jgi:enoyl-[acyl-carrier protein] reductase II
MVAMGRLERLWKNGADFLGARRPILCGGMTWVSDPSLVAAVSGEGAFGVLAGGNADPATFERQIDECLAAVRGPFAVNLITIAPNYRPHLEIVRGEEGPVHRLAGSFPKAEEVRGRAGACSPSPPSTLIASASSAPASTAHPRGSEAGGHIGNVSLTILAQQVSSPAASSSSPAAGDGRLMAHLLAGAVGCQFGTASSFRVSAASTRTSSRRSSCARPRGGGPPRA